jgi:hypothetical protein
MSLRIGFLFNHDQIHQVAHSLPVAVALARSGCDAELVMATTSLRTAAEVARLIGANGPSNMTIKALSLRKPLSQLVNAVLGKAVPTAKIMIYGDNLEFFRSLDALIVTERTSLILKKRYGLNRLKMILIDHGAGDRAIGFGPSTASFDHILAAGSKIRDRLISEAKVSPDKLTIAGYPKFDTRPKPVRLYKFRNNANPVILYNPHHSPHLSSWYKEGRAVLDFFRTNPQFNLIFAPHIMMFERSVAITIDKFRVGLPGHLTEKYAAAPNIHVDLGGRALTDMTYTSMADIYIGDVSSQVYEFLRTPRPCVFLNAHSIQHAGDPNFAHWQAGPVITSAKELGGALEDAMALHDSKYRARQKSLFEYTFDLTKEPSSVRAARAIADLLDLRPARNSAVHSSPAALMSA